MANNVTVERGRSLLTGIALLNPSPRATARFTMTVFNGRGQPVAEKEFTLPANQKISRLLSGSDSNAAFFDQEIALANGYVVVTSDVGLMGFELFFTNDLLQVASVPAQ